MSKRYKKDKKNKNKSDSPISSDTSSQNSSSYSNNSSSSYSQSSNDSSLSSMSSESSEPSSTGGSYESNTSTSSSSLSNSGNDKRSTKTKVGTKKKKYYKRRNFITRKTPKEKMKNKTQKQKKYKVKGKLKRKKKRKKKSKREGRGKGKGKGNGKGKRKEKRKRKDRLYEKEKNKKRTKIRRKKIKKKKTEIETEKDLEKEFGLSKIEQFKTEQEDQSYQKPILEHFKPEEIQKKIDYDISIKSKQEEKSKLNHKIISQRKCIDRLKKKDLVTLNELNTKIINSSKDIINLKDDNCVILKLALKKICSNKRKGFHSLDCDNYLKCIDLCIIINITDKIQNDFESFQNNLFGWINCIYTTFQQILRVSVIITYKKQGITNKNYQKRNQNLDLNSNQVIKSRDNKYIILIYDFVIINSVPVIKSIINTIITFIDKQKKMNHNNKNDNNNNNNRTKENENIKTKYYSSNILDSLNQTKKLNWISESRLILHFASLYKYKNKDSLKKVIHNEQQNNNIEEDIDNKKEEEETMNQKEMHNKENKEFVIRAKKFIKKSVLWYLINREIYYYFVKMDLTTNKHCEKFMKEYKYYDLPNSIQVRKYNNTVTGLPILTMVAKVLQNGITNKERDLKKYLDSLKMPLYCQKIIRKEKTIFCYNEKLDSQVDEEKFWTDEYDATIIRLDPKFTFEDLENHKFHFEYYKTKIKINVKPLGSGKFRTAHKMVDLIFGKNLVAKRFNITGKSTEDQKQDSIKEMVIQTLTKNLAQKFNSLLQKQVINYLDVFVYYVPGFKKNQFLCVEPFIEGTFTKWSNNGKWKYDFTKHTLIHCFSHWSYQFTKKKLLVVDLQGVDNVLTDPSIHFVDSKLDLISNLGENGIAEWFRTHLCSENCKRFNLEKNEKSPSHDDLAEDQISKENCKKLICSNPWCTKFVSNIKFPLKLKNVHYCKDCIQNGGKEGILKKMKVNQVKKIPFEIKIKFIGILDQKKGDKKKKGEKKGKKKGDGVKF
ncbi:eukaryotic elongation factor 2 kinase-related [Anaeramoeba flamelloides]|uniref:Eukaryotic elongation factor 2 kinase-related n=1 Tax=Anaeramoeba flamelloides TaxID=1746091 RepID=A0ABQ8Y2K9_9EUKA|nr:eukaryotic elongation factor 2 kinase-related [Anaeramoeba flamelloides]